MRNSKGMSMAMEIFIVLFVLIAVAMLVLNMVNTSITEQMKTLNEEQRKTEFRQITSNCQSACKCDTEQSRVGYCLKLIESKNYGNGAMDFTGNGFVIDYAEPTEIGGLYGLCEDRVYCSQIYDCKCGNLSLSMKNCFEIICSFWEKEGVDIASNMAKFFSDPKCDMADEQVPSHWSFIYSEEMSCA